MRVGDDNQRSSQRVSKCLLSNDELTRRLIELEQRVSLLESSLSPNVTWGVSQVELAETEKKRRNDF